jgi:hypothetical protein
MGYFISSVIGPQHPPVALHAMYCTRTVFLSTDTLIPTKRHQKIHMAKLLSIKCVLSAQAAYVQQPPYVA